MKKINKRPNCQVGTVEIGMNLATSAAIVNKINLCVLVACLHSKQDLMRIKDRKKIEKNFFLILDSLFYYFSPFVCCLPFAHLSILHTCLLFGTTHAAPIKIHCILAPTTFRAHSDILRTCFCFSSILPKSLKNKTKMP